MKRGLLIMLAAVAVVIAAGGFLYTYGTPQAPDVVTPVTAPGAVGGGVPSMGGGDPSAVGKKAPPADPNSPLAIQIPGCTCHSDDPKLVEEHAQYRMNQCAGCHAGR